LRIEVVDHPALGSNFFTIYGTPSLTENLVRSARWLSLLMAMGLSIHKKLKRLSETWISNSLIAQSIL
ncbi:MAG: hypothetical protein IKE24_00385, partial [Clostridia bacterium]|nr:hypothetical protein [Clostridia bacterium]